MRKTPSIIALILISIVAVSGCTQTGQVVSDTENETAPVCITVQEAYQNCQDVQVPYDVQENYTGNLDAKVLSERTEYGSSPQGTYASGTIRLQNTDTIRDWFTVTFTWSGPSGSWTQKIRRELEPGQYKDFVSVWNTDPAEGSTYTYIYSTSLVQKSRTTTEYRTEQICQTKYRDVQKCQ